MWIGSVELCMRERKRAESTNTNVTKDGRFAKKYVRKQWRTRCGAIQSFGPRGCMSDRVGTQKVEEPAFQRDQHDCISDVSEMSTRIDTSLRKLVVFDNDSSGGRQLRQSAGTLAKSSLWNSTLRNSRKIKKRRSSLRRKRGRPPSAIQAQKVKGALASELLRIKHEGAQFHAASPSPYKGRSTTNIEDPKSTMAAATQDASVNSCSTNLVITDTDKCHRVEGATITLELSVSNQWFLIVTKSGIKQCSLTAQKFMRPPSSNRSTHAVIWSSDHSLKLEFPDILDWLIFKELYKECSNRNLQSPAASVIPIPGVQELLIPVDKNLPFVRPESYISLKDDELTRALMNKTANYDMDSDDEEWLKNLNSELNVGSELSEYFTPENFELVIDALEKGVHCNPNEHLDEQAAYDICMHLDKKEIIEAVYKYWNRKRKQKRSALVKVFQLYQPRRSQVIPKFFLRKKRSFKRRASQGGRGKQQPLWKAAEGDAVEQENNVNKLQKAKAVADRNEGLATLKRERAQMLMENADLATYKAMMALKNAEAAAAQVVCNPVER